MRSVNVPPTSTPRRFMTDSSVAMCAGSGLLSWTEEDLSEEVAALHLVEGRPRLVERVGLGHQRPQQAAAGELEDLLELLARVDERSDDGVLRAEERDDVEGDDLARVGAAGHEAPVRLQRLQRLLEQVAADV